MVRPQYPRPPMQLAHPAHPWFRDLSQRVERVGPWLCVGGGVLAALAGMPWYGRAAAALLLAAGAWRLAQRWLQGRDDLARARERAGVISAGPSKAAMTSVLVEQLVPPALGHKDLDRQHRGLAVQVASLRLLRDGAGSAAEQEALLNELSEQFTRHHRSERAALQRLCGAGPLARESRVHVREGKALRLQLEQALQALAHGTADLDSVVDLAVQGVEAHLRDRHPQLPSIETALRRLRTQ